MDSLFISRIFNVVVGSAAEAEIGATYVNGQEAVPIRNTLAELQHSQSPTPMQVDNTTADRFANETIKQKCSKAINMRFHWIQDCVRQKQFLVYYRPGVTNLGDPFTKHLSPAVTKIMRLFYLHSNKNYPMAQLANAVINHLVRGCANSCLYVTPRHTGL
jgi:hypothetical protein